MEHISQLQLQGYKSIKDLNIKFENINIFIGGNGAGKSNLLSFFGLLKNIGNLEISNKQISTFSQILKSDTTIKNIEKEVGIESTSINLETLEE